jgi:hypothetical protein
MRGWMGGRGQFDDSGEHRTRRQFPALPIWAKTKRAHVSRGTPAWARQHERRTIILLLVLL